MIEVTTTLLEQSSPSDLVPVARQLPDHARIELVHHISPEFSKFLYQGVGSTLHWADRLTLSRAQWESLMRVSGTETHVLYVGGAPAGYVELVARHVAQGPEKLARTEVEIQYFGLLPAYFGQRLGGLLLTEGLKRAWDIDTRHEGFTPVARVWVSTCSLDSPQALATYQARGLRIFHIETESIVPGDARTGMWPTT